jgi:hypothetical protein
LTISQHAILWAGTAGSAVDLQPLDPTLGFSEAMGTSGNEQVGYAVRSGAPEQAFLWHGTAASAVDLNATGLPGMNGSAAYATNGSQEVGIGSFPASTTASQALVWSGTADSAVDLQPFLPATGTWSYSEADSINAAGNIFGYAIGTYNGATSTFAVEWSPIPEPATVSLVFVGFAATLLIRQRRPA